MLCYHCKLFLFAPMRRDIFIVTSLIFICTLVIFDNKSWNVVILWVKYSVFLRINGSRSGVTAVATTFDGWQVANDRLESDLTGMNAFCSLLFLHLSVSYILFAFKLIIRTRLSFACLMIGNQLFFCYNLFHKFYSCSHKR